MTAQQDSTPTAGAALMLGRAVLCAPAHEPTDHLAGALADAGFAVLAETARGVDTLPAVVEHDPDVLVLDVALTGILGMKLLEMIRMLAPRTAIIALVPAPLADLPEALAAGARAVVGAEDLRALREVLSELARQRVVGADTESTNPVPS